MRVLRAGVTYFALVFGVGFVLGPVRVLWLAPRVGERAAELLEMPVMLVVIILAARWVVRKLEVPRRRAARWGMGLIALTLLITAELGLVLSLRELTIPEYVAGRDPVAGSVYLILLAVFAAMPCTIFSQETHDTSEPE